REKVMRNLILGLGIVLSTSAFAKDVVGTGNFRRAEALKAAGASRNSSVVGVATSAKHVSMGKLPKESRLLMVDHAGDHKVTYVKAPHNKDEPVSKMSARQVNRAGLLTQKQAKDVASYNGGLFGDNRTVGVKNLGISGSRGSFAFRQ